MSVNDACLETALCLNKMVARPASCMTWWSPRSGVAAAACARPRPSAPPDEFPYCTAGWAKVTVAAALSASIPRVGRGGEHGTGDFHCPPPPQGYATRSARIAFDRDQSGGGIPPRQPQNPAGLDSVAPSRVPAVTSSQVADGEAGELPFPTLKA